MTIISDSEGHVLSGATGQARDLYERALELQRCYLGEPIKAMEEAIAAAAVA